MQKPCRGLSRLTRTSNRWPAAQIASPPWEAWLPNSGREDRRSFGHPSRDRFRKKKPMSWHAWWLARTKGLCSCPNPPASRAANVGCAFFHHPKGAVFVDEAARQALRDSGKSLLPPGIARCDGEFEAGEVVRVCDANGTEFARGIAGFSSRDNQSARTRTRGGHSSRQPGVAVDPRRLLGLHEETNSRDQGPAQGDGPLALAHRLPLGSRTRPSLAPLACRRGGL